MPRKGLEFKRSFDSLAFARTSTSLSTRPEQGQLRWPHRRARLLRMVRRTSTSGEQAKRVEPLKNRKVTFIK